MKVLLRSRVAIGIALLAILIIAGILVDLAQNQIVRNQILQIGLATLCATAAVAGRKFFQRRTSRKKIFGLRPIPPEGL